MEPCLKRRRVTMPFPPSLESWSRVERVDSILYPTLVLHLGYSLSSPSSLDELLLVHLCKLWSRLVDSPSHCFVDIKLECDLCIQILETTTNEKEIINSVLQVVSTLLDKNTNVVGGDQLAEALMQHVDSNDKVILLIHKLANAPSSPVRDTRQTVILYTAASCCARGDDTIKFVDFKLVDQQLFHLGMTMPKVTAIEEAGAKTFLWALSQSKRYAQKMSLSEYTLQYLVENKQSETLALIAEQCPTEAVAMHLKDLFMEKQCKNDERVLKGLLKCVNLLQPCQNLYDAILGASSSPVSTVAAHLICQLLEKSSSQSDDTLVQLLTTNDIRVSEIVMAYITKSQQQHQTSTFQPPSSSLMSAIADVASRNSVTSRTKENAIEVFVACAKDKSRWIEMARDSKLVEVLVGAVPNPMAMETLWQISTPMSNQRILAKHTGLLSSWIRFLRNIPPHDPRRIEWKDRLMQLAGLL